MDRNLIVWIFAFLLAVNIANAELPDLTQTTLSCNLEKEENGCFFYRCLDPEEIFTIEDNNFLNVFWTADEGILVLKEGATFDCTLEPGDYTIIAVKYGSNQFNILSEDNNIDVDREDKPDLTQASDSGIINLAPTAQIITDSPLEVFAQDISFISRLEHLTKELSIIDTLQRTVRLPSPDLRLVSEPPRPSNAPAGETPQTKIKEKTKIRSSNGNINLEAETIAEIEPTLKLEITRLGEFPSRIYGNTELSDISLNSPIKINPSDTLRMDSLKSFDKFGTIPPERKKWYLIKGLPKDDLLEDIGSLPENNEFFVTSTLNSYNSYLDSEVYEYNPLNSGGFDYHNIIEHRFEGEHLDQFIVILVVEDSLPEEPPTLQIFEVVLDRDVQPIRDYDLERRETRREEPTFDGRTRREITGIPSEGPSIFNPSDFSNLDQPQPPGTTAYNGYWVPQLVSQWSCQETDFPPTNPAYNNPTISSSCRIGEIIQRDTCGCLDQDAIFTTDCLDFTHVAEYSCSNKNCREPSKIWQCLEGTQCITGRDGGACKSPNFENLESTPGIEYGLFQYPLELSEEEVTIILTDNDLINSALCSSSTIDLSNLEVVETPLTGTAAVIKQITGFFSRITGKQTASPIARREYHQTLTTDAYSELANIRAYIPVIYFNENGARSSPREARILDRKVGSALLKTYGLERNNNLDALIASKQRSGEHSISGQGIIIRERASNRGESEEGFVTKIAPSDYLVFAGIPEIRFNEFRDLTFILVEAKEDKYFEINRRIYSVSKGFYLVPYPFNENLRYNLINDPNEVDTELKTYYEIAFDFRSKKYDVGVETKEEFGFCTTIAGVISMQVTFLTPAEADYFLRDIQSTFGEDYRFPSKTFTYIPTRRTSVEYFIIPLGRDYGGFKEGVYFVPTRSIISMDNEYDLSTRANEKQGMRHKPPTPNAEISYDTEVLDKIAELEATKRRLEGRIPCVSDIADLGEEIVRFIFSYRGEQVTSAADSS